MKIKWYGHSSFLITGDNGTKIITDPYEAGGYDGAIGYHPINDTADAVLCSHNHRDHGHSEGVPGEFKLIDSADKFSVNGINIEGIEAHHDKQGGAERGKIIIFKMTVDDVTVCHLGDLGHEIDEELAGKIKPVDVLLIPIGGIFTIDSQEADKVIQSILPRITIPMHYKTDKCGFPLARIDEFVDRKRNISLMATSEITITKGTLPKRPMIMLLDHAL
ncbi:MAG: MBL fold metallo-hydrolase [Candidatus Schekmanbacteria bacterium]|nr:MBL fold metallo-hydrolase [Candidatus Schekmanbacteria bacterium]